MHDGKIVGKLRYETGNLWQSRKRRWFAGIGVQIFVFAMNGQSMNLTDPEISLYDIWFSTFSGIAEYIRTDDGKFELPVLWILFQAYLLFILCDYVMDGLSDRGIQAMIRAGSRRGWMLRRNLVCAVVVAAFYLQYALISWAELRFAGSSGVDVLSGLYYQEVFSLVGWGKAVFMPVVMSVTLQLIQNFAGILAGSYTAYVISLGILILSAYKMSPFLIGSYGMLLRSGSLAENGMSLRAEAVICVALIIAAVWASDRFVKKFDMVGKGLEDKWK